MSENRVIAIIPARYRSTRFPGKPLVDLAGKPMIIHVAEIAAKILGKANVFVATDDKLIAERVRDDSFNIIMTSDELTGTDRVASAAAELSINADIIVNIQGDEPLISPADIQAVIDEKIRNPDHVVCGFIHLDPSEAENLNIPKVVMNEDRQLIYMSRAPIPKSKTGATSSHSHYHKQVCIYAFNKVELDAFRAFGRKSVVEEIEDIEILRFFELGIPIKMCQTFTQSVAVDTPEDAERVNKIMRSNV